MSELSNVEALLLAQAVWEHGSNAWLAVSKLLSKHPLLQRPKPFFSPNACHAMYTHLMNDAQLQSQSDATRAPENLKLAQIFYQRRLQELRTLISVEETKFKNLLAEIDAIRSGLWNEQVPSPKEPDSQVSAELTGATDSSHVQDVIMERAQSEEQGIDEQLTASNAQQESSETPGKDDMVLDVHVTIEKYPQPEEKIIEHEEAESSLVPHEAPLPSLDEQSAEEFRQAHRQEEEEEEEEREVILPEEEEAEQEFEAEPVLANEQEISSPAQIEVKDEVPPTPEPSDQAPKTEKPIEGIANEEEPQPSVRRSRRHRTSTSAAPPVQPKGPKARRSRRFSEAADTSPVSVDDEHEVNLDADTALEEADHDQVSSPINDEQRIDAKRKASLIEVAESPRDRKRHRDESEPVEEDEPGPSSAITRGKRRGDKTEEQVALKRFQNVIGMLHAQISQHRNGNIFHNPIKNSEAPDYHEIVKRSIDLKTIKAKVKDGHIVNSLEYQRDIYLMFANAMMYNVPGSDVYAMAEDMMLESESHISTFRQTEGLVRRF